MYIKRKFNICQDEALERIDNFLNELIKRQFPHNVRIANPSKEWSGNILKFSFEVKRWPLDIAISGTIKVEGQEVIFDAEVPQIVKTLLGEEKIKEVLNSEFNDLLG